MSPSASRRILGLCAAVLLLASGLRLVWLTADPPVAPSVGVVWHDEGAWTHNARNHALWGTWRTDEWNPLFITPVFTAMEAAAFDAFGVGTWQARLVPVASGLVAIAALMIGLWAIAGHRSALFGGVLLAADYTFVMWNRAALLESTMTMFLVIAWAAYALAHRRPHGQAPRQAWWGVVAGTAAVLAFFTKASAAFFIAALVMEGVTALAIGRHQSTVPSRAAVASSPALLTGLGLAVAGGAVLLWFVLPHWSEFQAYNWQMTVMRKPDYSLRSLVDRATWLPLTHPAFMRMGLVMLAAGASAVGVAMRWRTCHPAERLAVLWLLVGLLELVVHDSGNERRYVMFIPVLIGLAASRLGQASGDRPASVAPASPWLVAPVVLALTYVVGGSLLRLLWLDAVDARDYSTVVRVSAGLAVALTGLVWWRWSTWGARLATFRLHAGLATVLALVTLTTDAVLYRQWATHRSTANYDASRLLGTLLPPGTLVHGKLANGLALENRIRPLFVGQHFGNYADRLTRDDARYILTYTQPRLGYEGPVILDVLRHYPQQRIVTEFDVDETPGPDRAALIDKFPDGPESRARDQ